ncbi:beta-N-acetylhexosaminidase [Microbispora amethystogenes]|uniref:beta-N-acetylhexosaminidase n=1 Tax=Microbispora amethystogenes TaxID=1427754 RepID=A0ABQ4FDX0_9ACTN|nr:beta-N-acetylhexosaminidase [Microbispora amethystogenes]GIH32991.1 beta-N-acetylhexosaminidase [Microbispora amethystogenes]
MDDLLPLPRLIETGAGSTEIAVGAVVSGPAPLRDAVRLALGVLDPRPGDAAAAALRVEEDPRLGPEAYVLTIAGDGVRIAAGDRAGAFYAAQTLRQALPDEAFRSALPPGTSWTIPCGRVEDAPALAWRGAHLDVARSFLPKREVLRMIDLMASHKLNRLHLHLADDQGWRVESRAFPLLHEVGSHRPRTVVSHRGEDLAFDDVPHGGHYTLADLSEIAAYARARAVVVVPEIDVPGHASAVLAAYPALASRPGERHRVLDRWGISPAILSPLPATVDFLLTVFGEIAGALGEAPYFHIGGDECVLDDWAASAEISAHRASLGLESAGDLHAWFLRRLADALAERGSRAVVWDEAFVSGGLRPDTIVMPWRGEHVARRAAAAGHDVVATPVFPMYFDYAEAASPEEPAGLGDAITVADVAAFEPAPVSWSSEERARVIGTQFQLWSEHIPDGRVLDYRAWPRGCAAAEVAWIGGPAASEDFARRLGRHLGRLDAIGVEYRPLSGPRPWQRGGAGRRRHRPGVVTVQEVMRHLHELSLSADSTRPSM